MAVTLDGTHPTIGAYEAANKVAYYSWTGSYKITSPWYAGGTGSFFYKTKSGANYVASSDWSLNTSDWYPRNSSGANMSIMNADSSYSWYWGSGMGGNNSWYHSGYIWVR
jgi:hypothetical protein